MQDFKHGAIVLRTDVDFTLHGEFLFCVEREL